MTGELSSEDRRFWILERLKHSLEALAMSADDQIAYFPDFVVKTDELVLDFDHWRVCAIGNYHAEMNSQQLACLAAICVHSHLPNSPGANRSAWEESALYSHAFWEKMRNLAGEALDAFDWPREIPPNHKDDYVRG